MELLRTEYEEVHEQVVPLRELSEQLERLRSERDAALARLRQPTEPPEWMARQQQLEQQVAALTRQHRESNEQLEQLRTNAIRRDADSLPPQGDASSLGGGRSGGSRHTSVWYMVYQEEEGGKYHTITASTEEIRQWIRRGHVDNLADVHASRARGGPFDPLSSYAEFRDLIVPPVVNQSITAEPRRQADAVDLGEPEAAEPETAPAAPPEYAAGMQALEWFKMGLWLVIAIAAAMIVGQYLFRS